MPGARARRTTFSLRRFLAVSATLLLLAATAAQGQPTDPGEGPVGTIGVGPTAASDIEIGQRIRDVLREIDGFERVEVAVSSGVVSLSGEVLDSAAEGELVRIIERVDGVVAIDNDVRQSADLNERLAPALDRVFDRGTSVLAIAPIFLVALAVFVGIAAIGWLLTTRLTIWQRLAPNSFIAEIYRAVARIGFVVLGLVVALDILNATALIGAVLGAAGVVGLAVGFAVRDTVENFIASVLLSLRQPFRPNDFVEIAGDLGNVARLTSRATILISPDGNQVRIPNATVFKGRIVNYTRDANRRFTFELGVDAEADLAAALSTSVDALESLPFILDKPPVAVWIKEVGDSNVVMTLSGWIDQTQTDFLKARGEAIRITKSKLETAGFGLPEPIYRLKIDAGHMPAIPDEDFSVPEPAPAAPQDGLPDAAAPEIADTATAEVIARERAADDGGTNLLNENRSAE